MDIEQKLGLTILGLFLAAYAVEFTRGRVQRSRQPGRDAVFSLAGLTAQVGLSAPVLGALSGWALITLLPESTGAWAHWPFWPAFFAFILLEDFLHYCLHRYAHEWRWLWKLHRTHHSGTAMNVGLVFRYNVFWTLLLPQAWIAALLVYMGLVEVYFATTAVTFAVNVVTHMSSRWDLWLWEKLPAIRPLWSLVRRVITTPDTHHAHHGMGREAHSRGNYAVVFFLWDTLFGTGKIPHQAQQHIGLPHSGRLHWAEELFWPLVTRPVAPRAVLNPEPLDPELLSPELLNPEQAVAGR